VLFNITRNVLRFLYRLVKDFMSKPEALFFYICRTVHAVWHYLPPHIS